MSWFVQVYHHNRRPIYHVYHVSNSVTVSISKFRVSFVHSTFVPEQYNFAFQIIVWTVFFVFIKKNEKHVEWNHSFMNGFFEERKSKSSCLNIRILKKKFYLVKFYIIIRCEKWKIGHRFSTFDHSWKQKLKIDLNFQFLSHSRVIKLSASIPAMGSWDNPKFL